MELYSFQFLAFILISLIIHEIIGHIYENKQWIVRLLMSLFFYIMLSKWNVLFILISSFSIYYGARLLTRLDSASKTARKADGLSRDDKKAIKKATLKKKRLVIFLVILANLLILLFFKYIMPYTQVSLAIPLGISFYTFMAIAYIIDIYGEKYEAEDNFFKLTLYLIWFPQLIQGPINRYNTQKDTLFKSSLLSWDLFKYAMFLFLFGALKKYAIANPLAYPVERVFDGNLADKPGAYLLLGAFMFAIQQYADFSGGIDMVLAASSLFGVTMSQNFKQPYFSKSIAEFWRRWHITLGSFMKDYVFYPFILLAPMRKLMDKLTAKHGSHFGRSIVGGMGNILVFLLVGLWHGSQLHYILWGLYNGIIIASSDLLSPFYSKLKEKLHIQQDSRIFSGFQIFRTFMLIVLAGYFDRVSDAKQCIICFKNTFLHFQPALAKVWITTLYEWEALTPLKINLILISCVILLINSILAEKSKSLYSIICQKNIIIRWALVYLMMILVLSSFIFTKDNIGFMYEQF